MSSQSATYTNDAAQSQRHSTASELPPKYTASVDTFSIMTGKSGKSTSSKKVLGRIFQKKSSSEQPSKPIKNIQREVDEREAKAAARAFYFSAY